MAFLTWRPCSLLIGTRRHHPLPVLREALEPKETDVETAVQRGEECSSAGSRQVCRVLV